MLYNKVNNNLKFTVTKALDCYLAHRLAFKKIID